MIEMKSQAKANKSAFEKNLEQWTYFNQKLDEDIERIKHENLLKWAKQTREIEAQHKKKIKESAARAKEEAEQEIKAIEQEIHKKNDELSNDAVGQ